MQIKKNIYIQDDVLKDSNQDLFGHKYIAESIVNSIEHTKPPYIIGIYGRWGTGKSSLLHLIENQLSQQGIQTVFIDAWKYTSAKNLQRSFLVHVAREKAPNLLNELRQKIYTTEQETLPGKKSLLGDFKKPSLSQIGNVLGTFLIFTFFILVVLVLVIALSTYLSILFSDNLDCSNFLEEFFKNKPTEKFIELLFVPFLLTFVNYLRMFFIQRPITVTHERIDADELFTECFDEVVKKATKNIHGDKKRLIIFVDNLDRLSDNKMVEALESLKTYISNDHCVFVVACDANVVRNVINSSPRIPGRENGINTAGEHYLDKFFQQTFHVPEYMGTDLFDFAETNFNTTNLHDKLVDSGVEIRNLLSIILPSDITSPRKVKRILNDYIALYDIVERRENEVAGQLRPGIITANPEFLAKFSTIRTEYPKFYQSLVDDSSILSQISSLSIDKKREILLNVLGSDYPNIDSLVSYLQKTMTINVDDLAPYIWLSQDTLSLGLRREHVLQLRTTLSNNDKDGFLNLLTTMDADTDYQTLVVKVASRLVEQRLQGIEKQNGIKVLASCITQFDSSIRSEVAHLIAKLIPNYQLNEFPSDDVINVLNWTNRLFSDEINKLLDGIIDRLDVYELREETLAAIFENPQVIEDRGGTKKVQNWLKVNITSLINETSNYPEELHETFEWIIGVIPIYCNNPLTVENFFSHDLCIYMAERLTNNISGAEPVKISNEGLAEKIKEGFKLIEQNISKKNNPISFWKGLEIILENSVGLEELEFAFSLTTKLIERTDIQNHNSYTLAYLKGVKSYFFENPDLTNTAEIYVLLHNLDLLLQIIGNQINANIIDVIESEFTEILRINQAFPIVMDFLPEMKFQGFMDRNPLVDSVAIVLMDYEYTFSDLRKMFIYIARRKENLDSDLRLDLVDFITKQITSNDINSINNFNEIIDLAEENNFLKQELTLNGTTWLQHLENHELTLLQAKLNMLDSNMKRDHIKADEYAKKIISLLPFGNDVEKIARALASIESMKSKLSAEVGCEIFSAIQTHVPNLGNQTLIALNIIRDWFTYVTDDKKKLYISQVNQFSQLSPYIYLSLFENFWAQIEEDEIKNYLIKMYSQQYEGKNYELRSKNTQTAIKRIKEEDQEEFIFSIWSILISQKQEENAFINSCLPALSSEHLKEIRGNIRAAIKANSPTIDIENCLRFLSLSNRDDIRDLMPMVKLFVELYSETEEIIDLATKYVVPCLKPLHIRNDHKHILAEAMGNATAFVSKGLHDEIHKKAAELGLKWFSYGKYWRKR